MTFSKEDKAAWNDSEVMREFEKYAEELIKDEPEKDEDSWEEEEESFVKSLESFEDVKSFKDELKEAYDVTLISNIEKIANKVSSEKATYKIEMVIHKLKELLK